MISIAEAIEVAVPRLRIFTFISTLQPRLSSSFELSPACFSDEQVRGIYQYRAPKSQEGKRRLEGLAELV